MESIIPGLTFEIAVILAGMFFLILILLFMNIMNRRNINRLKVKYNRFMNGLSGRNIEELLDDCLVKVHDVSAKNREIENSLNRLERNLLQCVQKVGVVRFNAFENMGSDLSFSIALLDANDDGVIVSGIYARDSSSTYAKPISGGKSKYPLSVEEIQALEQAKKNSIEVQYNGKK